MQEFNDLEGGGNRCNMTSENLGGIVKVVEKPRGLGGKGDRAGGGERLEGREEAKVSAQGIRDLSRGGQEDWGNGGKGMKLINRGESAGVGVGPSLFQAQKGGGKNTMASNPRPRGEDIN